MENNLQPTYDESGNEISPQLPDGVKNYLIDIDGTICEDIPNEQPWRMALAEEYLGAREVINKWYDEGHIITFFTSRVESTRNITEIWLKQHGFKYHYLLMNKPRGGNYHWIDNHIVKATRYLGVWSELTTKTHEIEVFESK